MDPRTLAARVLLRVEEGGAWSPAALDAALGRAPDMDPRDRALATRMVYGTLAWRGRLDHALGQVVSRPLGKLDGGVLQVLRLGAYQLLRLADVPPHAAVDTSVRAVAALGLGRAKGLVNAALRRVESSAPPGEADVASLASLPAWLAERWVTRLGAKRALDLGRSLNDPPPGTIRAVGDREALAERLRHAGRPRSVSPTPGAADGLVVSPFGGLVADPSFAEGLWTVQDEASMRVVELLAPEAGDRVLDLCAAPGGKTTHVATRVGRAGHVDAVELHPHRGRLIQEVAERLGLASRVRVLVADGREYAAAEPYDRVLVDAPCSSLGVVRRRPEIKWRIQPERFGALTVLQGELLRAGARNVRVGGRLVFAVCSTELEEGDAVVDDFLGAEAAWVEEARTRTWPDQGDPPPDGFFAVRLRRRG